MPEIDLILIQQCIKQDSRAEYALYKTCFRTLMSVCYRYTRNEDDAADLVNKGFLKILNNLEKYDTTRSFNKWIVSIMINTIIDEYRSNKRHTENMSHVDMNDLQQHYHPVDYNDAEERLSSKEIHGYIDQLPETSKLILNLYVFEGRSHKEISESLNITESTSKWHLFNARNLLKQMIGKALSSIKMYML